MPQTITPAQFGQAQALLRDHDLKGFYQFFIDRGYNYAILAQGVINANTASGNAALGFMRESAIQQGKPLTDASILNIEDGMAQGYVATLQKQIDDKGQITTDSGASAVPTPAGVV